MVYEIGISTGFYRVARAADLLGIAAKIAYGAVAGVQFVQIDMESTSEFYEPDLKDQVRRVRDTLGMKVGMHGEIGAEIMSVDSALLDIWNRSHSRICETLKNARDLGMVYINVHLSARQQLLYEESRYRIQGYYYPVVDFFGQPLHEICDEVPAAKKIAIRNISKGATAELASDEATEVIDALEEKYKKKLEEEKARVRKELSEDPNFQALPDDHKRNHENLKLAEVERKIEAEHAQESRSEEFKYKLWKVSPYARFVVDNAEIGAYEIVAAFMKGRSDPLWAIHGKSAAYATIPEEHASWNAAVAAKYLWGHMMVDGKAELGGWANRKFLGGMSVRDFCNKHGIYLLFEVPESGEGVEGLYRLFNPKDAYVALKDLNSPYIGLCIDFEHMLAQKLNPDHEMKTWPNDIGKYIHLLHMGRPVIGTPGTTHAQIPLGSEAQEKLYDWAWQLKKKGFSKGWMIYERGGGNTPLEVIQQSVQALRQIKDYLDRDVPPDELDLSFYGIPAAAIYKRQQVQVRDNAYNPITGLIMIPEEAHTFFSRAAVEKGKAQEWTKGKYR